MPNSVRVLVEITKDTKRGPVLTRYALRFLRSDPSIGAPAYRLSKLRADGSISEIRDVILTAHGPQCTCQDATYRGRLCKHGKALAAAGFLDLIAR